MELLRRISALLIIVFAIMMAVPIYAAEPNFPVPNSKDKCPVCGMFVSKYPEWVASITYKKQPALFFDGAKDLFTYYLNPQKYAQKGKTSTIVMILVKDYYALKPIDAKKAFYVIGSNVYGPMGKELVPFEKDVEAREFMKDHKGIKIVRFTDVNAALLKSLE